MHGQGPDNAGEPADTGRAPSTAARLGGINLRRVLLGGLVAGLVYVGGGLLLAHWVLRVGMNPRLIGAVPVDPTVLSFLQNVGMRLVLGVITIYLYAALRPRFGPGPRTAIRSGMLVWVASYAVFTLGLNPLGVYPRRVLIAFAAWGLVEASLAAVAGAWLYREE